jgi:long-chain acyl-CoA synthetase
MNSYIDPLKRALLTAPDAEAVVEGTTRLTYRQLMARCEKLAGLLHGIGMSPGDRVAILSANSHRYLEAYIAIPASSFVIVPLNTRHAEQELSYVLRDSGARLLLTDRQPGALADLVERVIRIPDEYDALIGASEGIPLRDDLPGATLAGLFYTGGTTGFSKGVMLTHGNLVENAKYVLMSQSFHREDRFGLIAPMFHASGSFALLPTIWKGGCQVLLPTFTPDGALDFLEREKITRSFAVTTMLAMMAEAQLARPRDLSRLRELGHGGSPSPTDVMQRVHRAFPGTRLAHWYGATETTALITVMSDEQEQLNGPRARSCGQPALGVEMQVLRDDGKRAARGEIGHVVVRAGNVMTGYWNKPEETAKALRAGWYFTGDLGYVDDEHYLFLVDRAKDMIISGGENVYSTEVEAVLYRHPAVMEAAVFGVPDVKWGESVYAVVVPRNEVSEAELIAHCKQYIAGYKVPKKIELRSDPLPKSGPGKVLKHQLRAPFWAGRSEMIA